MTCITHLLEIPSKWSRMDMASTLLLHSAMHLRKRHTDPPRLALTPEFNTDMVAANQLLHLSREVLYEEKAHPVL